MQNDAGTTCPGWHKTDTLETPFVPTNKNKKFFAKALGKKFTGVLIGTAQKGDLAGRFSFEAGIYNELQKHSARLVGRYPARWANVAPQKLKICSELGFEMERFLNKLSVHFSKLPTLYSTASGPCLSSTTARSEVKKIGSKSSVRRQVNSSETVDLVPPPLYNKDHALLCSYKGSTALLQETNRKPDTASFGKQTSSALKNSTALKVGVQSLLVNAARRGFNLGFPLNTLLTVRLRQFVEIEGTPFKRLSELEQVCLTSAPAGQI
ncbi:hypothetical protein [Falsihalocynthiibacter arcticus]|uniref:Uncharacterized protein n=1 Tax=Falsihalocynthiibacter arcticus TaxID=1579316 RepID=A0A126V2G1_9RHOB|nr:hypothetical protein [Falsihalocynthiibacter arcticus]AML52483.1 hypothetical protein RC74_15455 [Falsihalocynthiibacter arcticus]